MMIQLGYGAYAFLVAATWVFARALDLSGIWLVLIAVLLVGYLIAPRFIWRLSVATHESEPIEESIARVRDLACRSCEALVLDTQLT